MGRHTLPANVHQLNNNPSKKSAGELQDAILVPVEIPDCPSHLLPVAKKEWKRITPLLEACGLISKLDRATLAAYCQAYARWVNAETEIKKLGDKGLIETTPSGYKQMSVLLQISNRAVDQLDKLGRNFGFSPNARAALNMVAKQGSLLPNDPMEAFLAAQQSLLGPKTGTE